MVRMKLGKLFSQKQEKLEAPNGDRLHYGLQNILGKEKETGKYYYPEIYDGSGKTIFGLKYGPKRISAISLESISCEKVEELAKYLDEEGYKNRSLFLLAGEILERKAYNDFFVKGAMSEERAKKLVFSSVDECLKEKNLAEFSNAVFYINDWIHHLYDKNINPVLNTNPIGDIRTLNRFTERLESKGGDECTINNIKKGIKDIEEEYNQRLQEVWQKNTFSLELYNKHNQILEDQNIKKHPERFREVLANLESWWLSLYLPLGARIPDQVKFVSDKYKVNSVPLSGLPLFTGPIPKKFDWDLCFYRGPL